MDNWMVAYETEQMFQAELVKELLEESNIEAVILNQKDSAITLGVINVMVNADDLEKATEVIKKAYRE